jgi:C-terminal processing protease CtpA/Prc
VISGSNGPADRAGLHSGDVLLRLDNASGGTVIEQISKTVPGTQGTIHFQRGSKHEEAPIAIEDQLALCLRTAAAGDVNAQTTLGEIYRITPPKQCLE